MYFMFHDFFSKNCAVYEIVWKNTVVPGRPKWHYNVPQKMSNLRVT